MNKIECTETRLDIAAEWRQDYIIFHAPSHRESNHYNYKTYLTESKQKNEYSCDVYEYRIKSSQKLIKALQARIDEKQNEVSKLRKALNNTKDAVKAVADERSFRQKINKLLKKHDYLDVLFEGDEEAYTTWVYSTDFDGGEDYEGDPFQDEHFLDSYQDAHERCLAYIKHHEGVKQ